MIELPDDTSSDSVPENIPDPDRAPDSMGALIEAGGRTYSLDGLIERIELAFTVETPPDRLRTLTDETDQRETLRDLTNYVLTTTGVRLGRSDVMRVINALHALLFRLGPLDPYLRDDAVCDLLIDGTGAASFRRFGEAWQVAPERFLDSDQVMRLVQRMAIRANVPFGNGISALTEIRSQFLDRPARLSVSAPPISAALELAIRLHPATPPTFDSLIEADVLTSTAGDTIRRAIADRRGLLIAGEPGTGKTMFVQALLSVISAEADNRLILLERAGELRLPDGLSEGQVTRYSTPDLAEPIAQVITSLSESVAPTWVIADEVRADETADWWALLNAPHAIPIWAFLSSQNPARLRSALNMLLRQRANDLPQAAIDQALRDRLPVVVLLGQRGSRTSRPRVLGIGEWTRSADGQMDLTWTP